MMSDSKAFDYISLYTAEILAFENKLAVIHNLNDLVFNEIGKIPKAGTILCKGRDLDYQFHGNGCTFTCAGIKVSYSIYTDRENYLAASPFAFMEFINSFEKDKTEKVISEMDALAYLNILEEVGFVNRIFEQYYVYEIQLKKISGN